MSEFVAKFSAVLIGILIILLVHAAIVGVSGLWKLFIRAGKPVWLAFIPVVNILVLWQIAHVLTLGVLVSLSCCITYFIQDYFLFEGHIPKTILGLVTTVLGYFLPLSFLNLCLSFRLSKLFGYGTGFALGLTFLWPLWLVFYWGSSRAQDNPDYGWFSLIDDGGSDFEFSLALRYLRPKRTAVSFITLISITGVMLGVAVLIIVTSVFSGFHLQLKKTFFQFSADIQIRQKVDDGFSNVVGFGPIENYSTLVGRLEKVEGVKGAMPIVAGKVMLETQPEGRESQFDAPRLIGVPERGMKKVSMVPQSMMAGEFDLSGNGLVVGWNFGRPDGAFQLEVGDTVLIYSPQNLKEMKDAKEEGDTLGILPEEYTVKGIFDAGQGELNDFMFCDLYNAQDLYYIEDDIAHMIWVETDQPLNLKPVTDGLEEEIGNKYYIGTWKDLDPVLLAQVQVEKMITQFLMFFIVIVAAFGIASSLIIFGVQKTKEIGLLKALGATNGQVSKVFLIQSAVVGILGTSLGIGLGMLVLAYRNEFLGFMRGKGIELFPEKLYGFRELPAQIVQSDIVVICGVSFLICILAGLLPAWNAARLQPVEALRSE